ncbi:uncharacterized protein LOC134784386 isoform X1 [Penaeus indicus]|uniref:uncharacterized protein LOC134784386 isoform X1 n=1 Tax=Penaeus indicus TaxID=29960 RepID=UPI00300CB4FA
MNGSIKWSDESTREFIQLRYKLRHLFNGRKHQCEKAYSRIVEELGLTNIITPTQARKKWSNLLQKYMDIKGGYSTANADWPYFQILDQIVPLMRKEKIEKVPPASVDHSDIEAAQESLQSPLTTPVVAARDPLGVTTVESVMVSAQPSTPTGDQCKTEAADGEPPRKRGRSRRAAQRARDRWWGAVEEDDLGSDSTSSAVKGEISGLRMSSKSSMSESLDPTQMEVQTFQMLESCSNALTDIRETLKMHAEQQESIMQSLQQTVVSQGNTIKELLSTMTSQNATLIALMTQLSTGAAPQLGIASSSFSQQKHRETQASHPHQQNQLLSSQQNIISALSHETQDCETSLVENSELSDDMTGL